MKATLLRDHPFLPHVLPEALRANCPVHRSTAAGRKGKPDPRFVDVPKGTTLDAEWADELKDLWQLCRLGVAIPADPACAKACGMTDAQIAEQARKYELMDKGKATGNPEIDAK